MRGIGFIEIYGTGIYMIITNKIYAEINGVSNKIASLERGDIVRKDLPGVEVEEGQQNMAQKFR